MNTIIPVNNQISNLSRDVLDAEEYRKPCLLLKLKDILSDLSQEQQTTLVEVWKYKLPQAILRALKQDFSLISGSWLTACHLINIAVECCHFNPTNLHEMKKEYIPSLVYTSLEICRNIVKEYYSAGYLFKSNLCGNISWIISALSLLMKKYVFVSVLVISSKNFLQFMMTEEDRLSILALSLLQNIIEANCDVFYHASESRMHNISDELAYKVSSTKDTKVARLSISILLNLLRMYSSLLDLFVTKRYRGFKTYLNKWRNNGFDRKIDEIYKMLEMKSDQMKTSQRGHNAAIIIQSCYRGYTTRKKLSAAARAISTFQRMYRQKMHRKQEDKQKQRLNQTRKEIKEDRRRKGFVESKYKQLKSIESIPAKTVDTFLRHVEEESARKIQATWSGWKARNLLKDLAPHLKREKAAVMIQRQVRRWLSRLEKNRKEARLDMIPDGLTDDRRVELQNVIVNIREKFPKTDVDQKELEELHHKAHHMLNNHVVGLRAMRRRDEHRRALLGQLSIQSDLFSRMPSLNSTNQDIIDRFSSRSTPVMMAARDRHVAQINELKKPWWEILSEDSASSDFVGEGKANPLGVNSSYITDYEKLF